MGTEFVRVKDPGTKHEVSVSRQFAEGHDLEILDKPAIDANGRPLAGKPHVELPKAEAPIEPTDDEKAAAAKAADPAAFVEAQQSGRTAGKAGNR
jgi:hypothetical protein